MKITVEFNSLQELNDFCNGVAIAPALVSKAGQSAAEGAAGVAEPSQKAAKAEKPTKSTPKAEKPQDKAQEEPQRAPQEEPQGAPAEPAKTEEPAQVPKVDENYRVQVRKTLAALNKKTGKNTASELIQGFGVEKLTGVAFEDLPALMAKAEEALNA